MSAGAGTRRTGLVLLAGVTLAWGTNWVFMKTSLLEIPLWQYRAVLLIVSSAGALVLIRALGVPLAVPRGQWWALIWAALFNVTLWHVFTAYGILRLASGQVSLIAFTMPVWATIMGVFVLGERLTTRRVVALVLGVGGIAVLMSGDLAAVGASPWGGVFAVLAAISWAAGIIIVKRVNWTIPTLTLVGWQLVIGAVPIAAIALAVEPVTIHNASAVALGAMVYTAIVAIVFAYWAWFRVLQIFPASVASVGTLLAPAIALLTGAAVFGEPLGWREAAAVALILSSLALVLLQRNSAPAPAE